MRLVTSVALPSGSVPTAMTVDSANGFVYIADGANIRYRVLFNTSTAARRTTSGCSGTPTTVSVGNDPVSLAVDAAAGNLYVANAGSGGGISVVSSEHPCGHSRRSRPVRRRQGLDGSAVVRSIGLSPGGTEIFAVLDGLSFPGDVLATINPTTQTIIATANLETGLRTPWAGWRATARVTSCWVTDQTAGDDVVQNLNPAVSDPSEPPYVTAVGGTSVTAFGPAPT